MKGVVFCWLNGIGKGYGGFRIVPLGKDDCGCWRRWCPYFLFFFLKTSYDLFREAERPQSH